MNVRFAHTCEEECMVDIGEAGWERLASLMEKKIESAFTVCGCHPDEASVSVLFTTQEGIRQLNRDYRDVDAPTDVLSFPLWENESGVFAPPEWSEVALGDVVISTQFVADNAKNSNLDYNSELMLVLIHGTLHLIGLDHDEDARKEEMWRVQQEILEAYFRGDFTL